MKQLWLLMILSLLSPQLSGQEPSAEELKYGVSRSYPLVVHRSIDGDTLEGDIELGFDLYLKKVSIRLEAIDAPELNTREGKASKKFVDDWLKEHANDELFIQVGRKKEKDKYGRILGIVFPSKHPKGKRDSINFLLIEADRAEWYSAEDERGFEKK